MHALLFLKKKKSVSKNTNQLTWRISFSLSANKYYY